MKLLGGVALALSLALTTAPATAREYRLLSAWDQNYEFNPHLLQPFIEGIADATEGRVAISVTGPEAVPPFEQLEPAGSGVFDFLFTRGAYHTGTTPILAVAEAIEKSPVEIRESGVFDYIDQHYQRFGLKLVMLPITPEGAYQIILREPVSDNGGFPGKKIRGPRPFKSFVEMMGGVLTILPPSDIYTALDSGLVDGAGWPSIGVLDYKWHEVAEYLLRPAFGVNYEPLLMNLDAWSALEESDQQALTQVARQIEEAWYQAAPAVFAQEQDELIRNGMKITEMGPEQKAKLKEVWNQGLWDMGRELNRSHTESFYEFVKSKGLIE